MVRGCGGWGDGSLALAGQIASAFVARNEGAEWPEMGGELPLELFFALAGVSVEYEASLTAYQRRRMLTPPSRGPRVHLFQYIDRRFRVHAEARQLYAFAQTKRPELEKGIARAAQDAEPPQTALPINSQWQG